MQEQGVKAALVSMVCKSNKSIISINKMLAESLQTALFLTFTSEGGWDILGRHQDHHWLLKILGYGVEGGAVVGVDYQE